MIPINKVIFTSQGGKEFEQAAALVKVIIDKVEQDSCNYWSFVDILKNNSPTYKEVLEQLKSVYRSQTGTLPGT